MKNHIEKRMERVETAMGIHTEEPETLTVQFVGVDGSCEPYMTLTLTNPVTVEYHGKYTDESPY